MDPYKSAKDYYSSSAPEVTPSSIPERAYQDYELPQPIQHNGQNGSAMAYHGSGAVFEEKSQPAKSSKKMLILSIIGAFAALAIGIGIGVGIGMSVEKNNVGNVVAQGDRNGVDSPASTAATSSTAPSSSGFSPTSTSTALGTVATGAITGVAAYSCSNDTQVKSSSDITYILDCNAAYLVGGPDLYDSSIVTANIAEPPYTEYSLQDCLDFCDKWNTYSDHEDNQCRTITYYANLTQAYGNDWMGNCFLKNGRPESITREGDDDTIDWEHTVSAYMTCLVNGGC